VSTKNLQEEVQRFYQRKGYNSSSQTLMLGLMEEVGELAQAILLTECDDFKPSRHKMAGDLGDIQKHKDVAAEVADVFIYALALCNRLGIKPKWYKIGLGDSELLVQEKGQNEVS
jgi:NTP pyrophosphatase (non-canonical NTP hydrolase)